MRCRCAASVRGVLPDCAGRVESHGGLNRACVWMARASPLPDLAVMLNQGGVGNGGVEALVLMVGLADEIDAAVGEAVKGLRACGCSWADIGSRLGITR